MKKALSGDIAIAYDDFGHGEKAFLFLPGWCSSHRVFQNLPALCSSDYRSIVMDWRGHGESAANKTDFGVAELASDAVAVIEATGVKKVIPIALSHAGWVAIELRKRIPAYIDKIIFLDWIITQAPPPFAEALKGMQSHDSWKQTVDQIFQIWHNGVSNNSLQNFLKEDMGSYGFDMWSRAAREISKAYNHMNSPLNILQQLNPHPPVLHLYAQPPNEEYLALQQAFSNRHPWFKVEKLEAFSHFPMFEIPGQMAARIQQFANERQEGGKRIA